MIPLKVYALIGYGIGGLLVVYGGLFRSKLAVAIGSGALLGVTATILTHHGH